MDFIEQLQQLANKTNKLCSVLQTEEATKNALIMPFINLLGYDIFDPTEVIPEFVADVGIKKGEKVDYAIVKDGKIIMLFECKHCGGDLNIKHASQLFRYFSVTEARIAVLTNGLTYRFYTDLEAQNKMDEKPFLEINMMDLKETVVAELKKLTKPSFNIDELMSAAGELKYTREVTRVLKEQMENPTDDFVKLFAAKVYDGVLTPARREYFTSITKRSFSHLINDLIGERLKSALNAPENIEFNSSSEQSADGDGQTKRDDGIETTAEEIEGYYIVKSLLRDLVDPNRIVYRDTVSYFGILLDDNNRKPIARLHFNRNQKYLGVFDETRKEKRVPISRLNDIYHHAEELRRVFKFYEKNKASFEQVTISEEVDILELV
jgi:hypothetical protein